MEADGSQGAAGGELNLPKKWKSWLRPVIAALQQIKREAEQDGRPEQAGGVQFFEYLGFD
jgi:hypothetical protein